MRYLGGKTRNAKAIVGILQSYREEGQEYFEPFCGGLSIATKMEGPLILNDFHEGLINLFMNVQSGEFLFPTKPILADEYKWYKEHGDPKDPMYTAVGFGLSYAGKWWGGYDSYYDNRDQIGHTTNMLVNSLKRKFNLPGIKSAEFHCESYDTFKPKDQLIYCDPPYENTTSYAGVDDFDHEHFWATMRMWSQNNTVLISEFNAPEDFEEIWSAAYKVQMCKEQQQVVEKLFTFKE